VTQGVNEVIGEMAVGGRVMMLNTRALVWIEKELGIPVQALVMQINLFQAGARATSVILWAGIENARRRRGEPGPEFTIDEAEQLVDEIGLLELQPVIGEAFSRCQAIRFAPKDGEGENPQKAATSTGESSPPSAPAAASTSSASST
jgi:hypothetical protein